MHIKILAEVEKIWILYDLDRNGLLDASELKSYIENVMLPFVDLSKKDDELNRIYEILDRD